MAKLKKSIEMVRGDLMIFPFLPKNVDTGESMVLDYDDIWFTVKSTFNTEQVVFQKSLSQGGIEYDSEAEKYKLIINPEDTESLGYGAYACDFELYLHGVIKRTFSGYFVLENEATWRANE